MLLWDGLKEGVERFKRGMRGSLVAGDYDYDKGEYLGDGAYLKSLHWEGLEYREGDHVLRVDCYRPLGPDVVVVNSNQWSSWYQPHDDEKITVEERVTIIGRMHAATRLRVIDEPK